MMKKKFKFKVAFDWLKKCLFVYFYSIFRLNNNDTKQRILLYVKQDILYTGVWGSKIYFIQRYDVTFSILANELIQLIKLK